MTHDQDDQASALEMLGFALFAVALFAVMIFS